MCLLVHPLPTLRHGALTTRPAPGSSFPSSPDLQGSLPLRLLSQKHRSMMHVARVAYKEEDAEAWQARLLIQRLPPAPFLVFFRGPGPGAGAEVLPLGKGAAAELGKEVEKKGLFWQTLPALRPATLASLGCGLGGADAGMALADLCVVAMTPQRGANQVQSRTNTLRLLMMLYDKQTVGRLRRGSGGGAGLEAASLAAVEAAARAVEAGKLRITWVDASTQQAFCR